MFVIKPSLLRHQIQYPAERAIRVSIYATEDLATCGGLLQYGLMEVAAISEL